MAQWLGICGVRLAPLGAARQDFILGHRMIHVDETPVPLLAPARGKTKTAYVWVYRTTDFETQPAALYDFTLSRGGEHPRRVLDDFSGTLGTDDFSGDHALHRQGVKAALCMAHARRELFEAHALNDSQIAGQAVAMIARLYEIKRQARQLKPQDRLHIRQLQSKPGAEAVHAWLRTQRQPLVKADATAKAIDYALSNRPALTQFLDDGARPIDNNAAENAIHPLAVARKDGVCRTLTLSLPGPLGDGGLDELLEPRLARSLSSLTRSSSSVMTAWHSGTVCGSYTPPPQWAIRSALHELV